MLTIVQVGDNTEVLYLVASSEFERDSWLKALTQCTSIREVVGGEHTMYGCICMHWAHEVISHCPTWLAIVSTLVLVL